MSSRLALDGQGRKVVIVTTSTDGLPVGYVFAVVDWTGFFEPRGRPPTARERTASSRFFYDANSAKRQRTQEALDDDQLDEAEAIRQAMIEQRRRPVDLLSTALKAYAAR
jgi:hypothetical protein